ncbi:MAG: hypothetical protein IK119_01760, partial [Bacteroidales bacterium]|nr:hypothetical protein [Bacteroidales bacterium]
RPPRHGVLPGMASSPAWRPPRHGVLPGMASSPAPRLSQLHVFPGLTGNHAATAGSFLHPNLPLRSLKWVVECNGLIISR